MYICIYLQDFSSVKRGGPLCSHDYARVHECRRLSGMVKYTGWRRGGSRRKTRGIFGRRFGYTKRFDKGITYGIRVAWEINCFPGGGGKKYFPLLPFSFLSLPPLMYSDIRRETTTRVPRTRAVNPCNWNRNYTRAILQMRCL